MRARDSIALCCFFLSGFAGLVYEVAWIREASLVFGSTTYAVSTVLAVFFLGLAGGSHFFGVVGARSARPLRWFAGLEIGLAVLAFLSTHSFDLVERLYGAAYGATAAHGWLRLALRAALVAVVVLPPALLMGGTLPLFCRWFVRRDEGLVGAVGALYGLNTLGAALGCAAAGLVLLPQLGLLRTVQVGAGLNLVSGLVVLAMHWPALAPAAAVAAGPARRDAPAPRSGRAGLLFFLVGFVALGSEVLWVRYLGLLLSGAVRTYTLVLTVVLAGIVLGSLLAGRVFERSTDHARDFGALQVGGALAALSLMLAPPDFWRRIGTEFWTCFVLLLPAAVLSGASLPLAVRIASGATGAAAGAARVTGRLVAVNTLGGIAGSALVGFVALPRLGLDSSLRLVTGVGLATGCVAWLALRGIRRPARRWTAVAAAALAWFALPGLLDTRLPADLLGPRGAVVDTAEGLGSNLAVLRDRDGSLQLRIDRWWQGSDRKNHQVVAAHLPMLLHPEPRRVLMVGVGTGQTASRFLMHDIERLEAVDVEPAIFPFVREHFDAAWMDDPRVALIFDDGRNHLLHGAGRHDVISLEVGQIIRPGVAFFYTLDFYRVARDRLAPGGIVAQFVPMPFFTVEQFRGVVRTFVEVFPQSQLWYNTSELLLLGFAGTETPDLHGLLERLDVRDLVRQDLEFSVWGGPEFWLSRREAFLAGLLAGPRELARIADGAAIYRDDRPVLDHATRAAIADDGRERESLRLLRENLLPFAELGELPGIRAGALDAVRDGNLREIESALALRRVEALEPGGDWVRIRRILEVVVRDQPEHVVAARLLGDAACSMGDFEAGRRAYSRVLERNAGDALAHHGLGNALVGLQRFGEARGAYEAALALRPEHARSHHNLGAVFGMLGDHRKALEHFEEALRLDPHDQDARRNRELARFALRRAGD